MKQRIQHAEEMTVVDDGLIIALWNTRKFDTVEIAAQLRLREYQVANRLLHLRGAMK